MDEKEIDEQLVKLNRLVGHNAWLKSTTPANLPDERKMVLASSKHNPQFILPSFEKLGFDPKKVMAQLEVVERNYPGTVYGNLQGHAIIDFRQYLESMLARGSKDFQYSTEAICQRPDETDRTWAEQWYKREAEEEPKTVTPAVFKDIMEGTLKASGLGMKYIIIINDKRQGIAAFEEEGRIEIPDRNRSVNELRAAQVHEIKTHIFQYQNGCRQSKPMFRYGFPGRASTSEGLALCNEQRVGAETDIKRKVRAGRIKAMLMAPECSFADMYNELLKAGFTEKGAFSCAYSAKRGLSDASMPGANFGPNIYVRGLRDVKAYLNSGGEEDILYAGRVSLELLDDIRSIGFRKPKYKPVFDD